MNKAFAHIWLSIVLFLVSGCQEFAKKPVQASIEGIKISDIEPVTGPKLAPKITFRIFTFEADAKKTPLVQESMAGLTEKALRFTSYKAFKANGFSAGFGQGPMWNAIAEILRQAGAKRARTNNLMVFDSAGDYIDIAKLDSEQSIFYADSDGTVNSVALGLGQLGWYIKAEFLPGQRGAAEVEIQPVFRLSGDDMIARLAGIEKNDKIFFDAASFRLKMGRGDFVLIGPGQYDKAQAGLARLFFTRRGDLIVSEPAEEQTDSDKNTVRLERDVQLIRLYLIACMGAGD